MLTKQQHHKVARTVAATLVVATPSSESGTSELQQKSMMAT
jgi:hypothetical protein